MSASTSNVISIASYLRSISEPVAPTSDASASASGRTASPPNRRARRTRTTSSIEDAHDDDIVERMIMGDIDAAAQLRARYIRPMRRAARAILCDEREAARAADAALEEACDGWPPERGRVDRWLLRLARRAAVARRKTLWGLGEAHEPRRARVVRTPRAQAPAGRAESGN